MPRSLHIVVASTNPVKQAAVKHAFSQAFPDTTLKLTSVDVDSGVPDQPSSDEETLLGAHNRASRAKQEVPSANFWVGLEGGVQASLGQTQSFAWIVVKSHTGTEKSRTATFTLPTHVTRHLSRGKELGDAMDITYSRHNSKQQEGAVGILTHGLVTRASLYQQAVLLALIPYLSSLATSD